MLGPVAEPCTSPNLRSRTIACRSVPSVVVGWLAVPRRRGGSPVRGRLTRTERNTVRLPVKHPNRLWTTPRARDGLRRSVSAEKMLLFRGTRWRLPAGATHGTEPRAIGGRKRFMTMPTDFADAHRCHWKDTELLFVHRRLGNADQIYGFSAECGLNAVMKAL